MKALSAPLTRSLVSVVLTAAMLLGCDMGLQGDLDQKKEARFAHAIGELRKLGDRRTGLLNATLPPKDAQGQGRNHPMLFWRNQITYTLPFVTKFGLAEGEKAEGMLGLAAGLFKAAKSQKKTSDGIFESLVDHEATPEPVESVEATGEIGVSGKSLGRNVAAGTSDYLSAEGVVIPTALVKAAEEGLDADATAYYVVADKKALGWFHVHSALPSGQDMLGLAKTYRGTPMDKPAIDTSAFIDKTREYWAAPYGEGVHAEYLKFLQHYLAGHQDDLNMVELATKKAEQAEARAAKLDAAAKEALAKAEVASGDEKAVAKVKDAARKLRGNAARAAEAAAALREKINGAKERRKRFVPRRFLEEARFDQFFLHAAREYEYGSTDQAAVREATAARYWPLAFHLARMSGESLSDYKTRLCLNPKLEKNCEGVPHEKRFLAIHRPYLEWVEEQITEFKKSEPDAKGAFLEVANRYGEMVAERKKMTMDLTEDPILPASMSARAGAGGAQFVSVFMSPKSGIFARTDKLAETFNGTLDAELLKKLTDYITALKEAAPTGVDYTRAIFEGPGDMKSTEVTKFLQALPAEIVETIDLVGRRRVDKSLRKTGFLLGLPRETAATTSYQFKGDEKRTACPWWGFAGAPRSRSAKYGPGHYLVIGKDRSVKAAKLHYEEVKVETPPGGEAPKPNKDDKKPGGDKKEADAPKKVLVVGDMVLNTNLDDPKYLEFVQNTKGYVRLFLPSGFSWSDNLELMTSIVYECVDTELKMDDFTNERRKIECGLSKERRITLVVAVCD